MSLVSISTQMLFWCTILTLLDHYEMAGVTINKAAYVSSNYFNSNTSGIVDGKFGSNCLYSRGGEAGYAIVDMKQRYDITKIVISPVTGTSLDGYNIYVSDGPWRPCATYQLLQSATFCGTVTPSLFANQTTMNYTCTATGRYVALISPKVVGMYYFLCELYAEGTLSADQTLPSSSSTVPYQSYCAVNTTGENVAYGKKACQSSTVYTYGPNVLVDGFTNASTYTYGTQQHWNVVDLGQTYNVKYVRLWITSSLAYVLTGYQIAVSENFRACKPEVFLQWPACATLKSYGGITMLETSCIGKGRFVLIRAPNVTSQGHALSEIEVYGTPATNFSIVNYLATCSPTTDGTNLAYKGAAYSSSTAWGSLPTLVTDGSTSQSSYTVAKGQHWLVVDLSGTSNVVYVRLWTRDVNSASLNGYTVSLGGYFRPCAALSILRSFTTCKIINSTAGQQMIEFQCIGVGRYLAIVAPSVQNLDMVFTEVEVFGDRIAPAVDTNDVTSRCVLTKTSENLAYLKPSYQSSVTWSRTFGTDGLLTSCIGTDMETYPWMAVDLQQVSSIKFVRLWNNPDVNSAPYVDILIGTYFRPCEMYILDNLKLCKRVPIDRNSLLTEANCTTPINGQFVILKYGSPNDTSVASVQLSFNEIEVFGDPTTISSQQAPTLDLSDPNLPVTTVSGAKAFILANVNVAITLGYGACRVDVLTNNSETILGVPNSGEALMVATQYQQGRMISMGYHELLNTIRTSPDYSVMWTNMQNWLKAGLKTTPTNRIAGITNFTDGDIVVIQGYVSQTTLSQIELLHSKLSQGAVAVIHALSAWQIQFTALENINQYALCNLTKVFITNNIISWGTLPLTYSTSVVDYSHVSVEYGLQLSMIYPSVLGKIANQFNTLKSMKAYHFYSYNLSALAYQVVTKYQDFVKYHQPCVAWPQNNTAIRQFLYGYNQLILSQLFTDINYKAPGVFNFPGDFPSPPPTIPKRQLRITANYKTESHSTGLYMPAGSTLYYTVDAMSQSSGRQVSARDWRIRIGCNTDDLVNKGELYRFPVIALNVGVNLGKVYSPFGGIVWIQSNVVNSSLTITFYNAVETPYFNLRDPVNVANYNVRRNAPGLWADIAGDAMILCLPSSYIRSFNTDYVTDLMSNHWDKIVKLDYDFQGLNWRLNGRQRAAIDIQISIGWGHSGYPIMGYLPWFDGMWNKSQFLIRGSWGMTHEIGHNMQRGVWTFAGTGEVTNNMFGLFDEENVWGLSILNNRFSNIFSATDITNYLNSGAVFDNWKASPFVALGTYFEIALCYGWGTIKNTFLMYLQNNIQASTDQDKMDMWLYTLSFQTKRNLKPIFDYWGVPISAGMATNVSQWQCSLPNDVFTQYSPSRADSIRDQYDLACTSECSPIPFTITEPLTPMMGNDVEQLL